MKDETMKTADIKNVLSVADAAKLLGITCQGVYEMWKQGKFTGRKWGRVIMLDKKSVEQFVAAYKIVKKK